MIQSIIPGTISGFNSRTRKGCDTKFIIAVSFDEVSIHAPVKGATLIVIVVLPPEAVSIHAPVKGATKKPPRNMPHFLRFNSRTRKGCDNIELNDYIKKI